MPELKRWRQLVKKDEWYHLARFRFGMDRVSSLHTHDFPEIFWLERGTGTHHINGQVKRLDPGDLVFIRPTDEHRLSAIDSEGFVLVNLAFAPAVLADVLERYTYEATRFHDVSAPLPVRIPLARIQRQELAEELAHLAASPLRGRMLLERFLMSLYLLIGRPQSTERSPLPDWLVLAMERIQERAYFVDGARGFVRAAGRSPEHVARTVREHLGCTPSEYVNRIRMNHATRELRLGARAISDIAADCGIGDLAHFYALFGAAFRTTPRRYRLEHHRQIT